MITKFKFIPPTSEDLLRMIELWSNATKSNLFTPNEEEINHLRRVLGFPEGEVKAPTPKPTPGFANEGNGPDAGAEPREAGAGKDANPGALPDWIGR